MKLKVQYLLAAAALTLGTVAPAVVHAQSPMQFWIQEQRHWDQRTWEPPRYANPWEYGRPPGRYYEDRENRYYRQNDSRFDERRDPYEPQVRVKSPNYHDYTPDTPKPVALDKVCEVKVASNAEADPMPDSSFTAACAATKTITLRVLPEVGAALNDYYSNHPRFLWVNGAAVSEKARVVMAALARSDRYGLNPADYRVALPAAAVANAPDAVHETVGAGYTDDGSPDRAEDTAKLQQILRFELALSARVLTYVLDATRGRIDPDRMSDYYDLPRKDVDLSATMGELAKADDIASYLDSRNPDSPQFRALVAALAAARAAAPKEPVVIPDGTFIRPGADDPALPQVVAAIRQSGSASLKEKHADTLAAYEGGKDYGDGLVALVRDFQREKSLQVDGIVGPNTIRATRQATPAEHISKLTLAMERMRWLPHRLGQRYVLLNEPAYQVTYVKDDGTSLIMRAIVGKPNHQTYFFTDTIEAVEYNPYWNVPRSIVINEMLPHLYDNPRYLDRRGYEVINAGGRRISSGDVDWSAYAREQVSVDVRQPPGRRNALGVLKIEFPNAHAIYMHDTPEKQLFKNRKLAFSHGCVRLEHPKVMAAALLDKPVSYVEDQIATGQNHSEEVDGDIPVYLTYFTAWPDRDGSVRYYADVYGRDGHLEKALEKTEAVRARSAS